MSNCRCFLSGATARLPGQLPGSTGLTDCLTEEGEITARRPKVEELDVAKVFTSPLRVRLRAEASRVRRVVDRSRPGQWDYGQYEGRRTAEILAERPGWSSLSRRMPEVRRPGCRTCGPRRGAVRRFTAMYCSFRAGISLASGRTLVKLEPVTVDSHAWHGEPEHVGYAMYDLSSAVNEHSVDTAAVLLRKNARQAQRP